jgi:hypothetical protein
LRIAGLSIPPAAVAGSSELGHVVQLKTLAVAFLMPVLLAAWEGIRPVFVLFCRDVAATLADALRRKLRIHPPTIVADEAMPSIPIGSSALSASSGDPG